MSIEFIDAEIKKECLFFQMESREDFSSLLNQYSYITIMEFLKSLFKDDEKAIGLCSFQKKEQKVYTFTPEFGAVKLIYSTNTKNNFLLS